MEFLHFGNRDGEKFVILPGLALKSVLGSAGAIISAYSPIAENHDVYLFDHIPEEPEAYGIADMAEDTLTAFGREGIDRACLMGVSMGGMVAQTMAVKAPERVSALILCSTAMDASHADTEVLREWRTLAQKRDTPALMEAFGKSVYTPAFWEQYGEFITASGYGATELDFRNFLISLDAVGHFDLHEEIGNISCPAFVLGAGDDRVLGRQAAYDLADALDCPYYIYEGYGHGVYDEAPDYLSRIDSFLKSLKTDK